jgi:hypothetical protein
MRHYLSQIETECLYGQVAVIYRPTSDNKKARQHRTPTVYLSLILTFKSLKDRHQKYNVHVFMHSKKLQTFQFRKNVLLRTSWHRSYLSIN